MTHEEKIEELYSQIEQLHSDDIKIEVDCNGSRDGYQLTPIEEYLYITLIRELRTCYSSYNIFPQKKYEINGSTYIVDFYIEVDDIFIFDGKKSITSASLIVECDGHDFHEKTKQQAARDKKRDRDFLSIGLNVMRFTGSEIYNSPFNVAAEISSIMLNNIWKQRESEFEISERRPCTLNHT